MKRSSYVVACIAIAVASAASAQSSKSAATPPAKSQAAKPKAAKPTYHRTLPASLMKEAKITESTAADAAMKAVPDAKIEKVKLEKKDGTLEYTYDLKSSARTGVDEVRVNATTGAVISNVHQAPAEKKAEAPKPKKPEASTAPKAKKP